MLRHVLALVLGLAATMAAAQSYPNRPIRLIVPFPPGGTNELLARIISQRLQEKWGQAVVTENRAGAGGNIGADAVAKSTPDGYTLLFGTNTLTMNPFLVKQMPFDVQRDLAPVAMIATTPFIVVVNNNLPVHSIAELIAHGKANAGKLSFGSAGTGTPHHLGAELFRTMTGVQMVHVPYKGSAQALTDVMTGQLDLMWVTINVGMPLVSAAKLRAIAVGEPQRLASQPELPSVAETLPGYEVTAWYAVFAPAGTPPPLIEQLSAELVRVFQLAEVKDKLTPLGVELTTRNAAELRAVVAADLAKWRQVVAQAGLKPE